jgi:predicted AAA+ superfamily ATPase
MIKYAPVTEKPKVRKCYDSIPKQLAKENKKFQYSVVEKNSTSRKFGNSLDWLLGADVIYKCANVSTPQFPLKAYECDDYFKIYVNDIGLLVAMYGFEMKQAIISNTLKGPAKGGIYENLIADMLVKNGYNLNYYKLNDNLELEFLIPCKDQVIPIEVKAGNTATVSLNRFIDEYKPTVAYKFITGNLGVADTKVTMPLYMAMFLKK